MSTEPVGGLGGDSGRGIRDTRLAERALREHWPIPEALRGRLVDRLARIIDCPEASPREAISAAKALLSASKINLGSVTAAIKADEYDELRERVAKLERGEHPEPIRILEVVRPAGCCEGGSEREPTDAD